MACFKERQPLEINAGGAGTDIKSVDKLSDRLAVAGELSRQSRHVHRGLLVSAVGVLYCAVVAVVVVEGGREAAQEIVRKYWAEPTALLQEGESTKVIIIK